MNIIKSFCLKILSPVDISCCWKKQKHVKALFRALNQTIEGIIPLYRRRRYYDNRKFGTFFFQSYRLSLSYLRIGATFMPRAISQSQFRSLIAAGHCFCIIFVLNVRLEIKKIIIFHKNCYYCAPAVLRNWVAHTLTFNRITLGIFIP